MNSDNLLSYLKRAEAINHSVLLTVKKPKTNEKVDFTGVLQAGDDDDVAIFRFDLPSRFTNQVGECIGELLDTFTENGIEKQATSDVFSYTIKASQMNDLKEEPQGSVDIPLTIYNDETGEEIIISVSSTGDVNEVTLEEVAE